MFLCSLCLHLHPAPSSVWIMCLFSSSHKEAIYTGLGFTLIQYNFSSFQSIRSVVFDSLWPHGLQHTRLSCHQQPQSSLKLMSIESVMPSNHSSSVIPFSSCLQSFPESGSFPMSQFFTSGGRSIEVSASASVL